MGGKNNGGRSFCPSSAFPFFSVATDGKHKKRHHEEVLFLIGLLKKQGMQDYNLHHIDDVGLNKLIPLKIGKKIYDFSYVSRDGEIFLIEVMRIQPITGKPAPEKQEKKEV